MGCEGTRTKLIWNGLVDRDVLFTLVESGSPVCTDNSVVAYLR